MFVFLLVPPWAPIYIFHCFAFLHLRLDLIPRVPATNSVDEPSASVWSCGGGVELG
jgi:hypothetical protein